MAPAVCFSGKSSERMACAANNVAPHPQAPSVGVTAFRSITPSCFFNRLNLPRLIVHQPRTPTSRIQESVGHRFSSRQLPMAKFVFTFSSWGCSLISFKICSTWTQMTVNGSCGTLHAVCVLLKWHVAQLRVQDVLVFFSQRIEEWPEGPD